MTLISTAQQPECKKNDTGPTSDSAIMLYWVDNGHCRPWVAGADVPTTIPSVSSMGFVSAERFFGG